MSKRVNPDNSETSVSETITNPVSIEKAMSNDVPIKQSILRSERSVEPSVEIGGQKGPEPTRFGDWEKNGRCTDF